MLAALTEQCEPSLQSRKSFLGNMLPYPSLALPTTKKVVWKETQREVRQHWFIYSYISAYIQTLYMYCPGLLEYIH